MPSREYLVKWPHYPLFQIFHYFLLAPVSATESNSSLTTIRLTMASIISQCLRRGALSGVKSSASSSTLSSTPESASSKLSFSTSSKLRDEEEAETFRSDSAGVRSGSKSDSTSDTPLSRPYWHLDEYLLTLFVHDGIYNSVADYNSSWVDVCRMYVRPLFLFTTELNNSVEDYSSRVGVVCRVSVPKFKHGIIRCVHASL